MEKTLTLSVTKMSAFLNGIEVYRISREELLRAARIEASVFGSPDNRLNPEEVKRMMETAVALTQSENIGLYQGDRLSRGFSNILGYVLMNCPNLGVAAEKYCKYEKVVDGTNLTEVSIEDGLTVLSTVTLDAQLASCRPFTDFKISGMYSYMRLLAGKEISLEEVWFSYKEPKDTAPYRKIFNCPVYFERDVNALTFDKKVLDWPLIEPNADLLALFESNTRELLHSIENKDAYTKQVFDILQREAMEGTASVDIVANKLAVSVRSLQNYLKREGTTFNQILREIRKGRAQKLLLDKSISVDEIAYAMGFSETSAFHRAFKKWVGMTPGEYREFSRA